jgi:hypothetical protein
MPKDPLTSNTKRPVSPLYRNTEKMPEQQELQREEPPPTQTDEEVNIVPFVSNRSEVATPELTKKEPTPLELPPGPPVRRKKIKGLKFSEMYTTRSLSVDNRLLPYFDDFFEAGSEAGSKTSFANQLLLKILRDAGYQIPLDIFSQPIRKPDQS